MDIPLLVFLLTARDEYENLSKLRGGLALAVGGSIMAMGAAMIAIAIWRAKGRDDVGPVYGVLSLVGALLVLLGSMITILRTCGEPCENYVPGVGGSPGYCAD